MKNLKIVIFIFFFSIIFSSCEKVIKFKGEQMDPMLVISSFVNPDTTVKVVLSHSAFFLNDAPPSWIYDNNAIVTAKINAGNHVPLTFREEINGLDTIGYYCSDFKPMPGDIVEIKASLDGYATVSARDSIPFDADFIIKSAKVDTVKSGKKNSLLECNITLSLNDDNHTKDYYMLELRSKAEVSDSVIYEKCTFTSDDIIFQDTKLSFIIGNASQKKYFSDELFDGKEYTFQFNSTIQFSSNASKLDLIIDLKKISYSYFTYLSSLNNYITSSERAIVYEKVSVFSNVNDGLGIIGAENSKQITINLK